MSTHWIPPFTRRNKLGHEEALCGAWIDPRKEFSTEPTCLACLELLQEDVETAQALEQEFPEFAGKLHVDPRRI